MSLNVRKLTNSQLAKARHFLDEEIARLFAPTPPAPLPPLTKDDVLKMATADAAKDSDTHIYLDRDGTPLAALTTVSDLDRVYKMLGKVPGPDPDQARHYARSLENAKASKSPCKVDDCSIDHNDLTEDAFIEHTGLNPNHPASNYHPNYNPDGSVKARFDLMFGKSATITKRSSMSFDWQTNPTEGPGRECPGCQEAADNSPYDDPYSVPDPNEICLGMLRGNGDCTCQIYIGDNDEPVDAVDFDPTDYDPTLKAATITKGDVPGHEFHGNQYTGSAGEFEDAKVKFREAESKFQDHLYAMDRKYGPNSSMVYANKGERDKYDRLSRARDKQWDRLYAKAEAHAGGSLQHVRINDLLNAKPEQLSTMTLKAASADLTFDQKLAKLATKQASTWAEQHAQEVAAAYYGSDSDSSSSSDSASSHDHLSSSDEAMRLRREFPGAKAVDVDVDAITKRIEAKAVEAIDTVKARTSRIVEDRLDKLAKSKKEKSITTRDIRRVVEEVVQEQLKAQPTQRNINVTIPEEFLEDKPEPSAFDGSAQRIIRD